MNSSDSDEDNFTPSKQNLEDASIAKASIERFYKNLFVSQNDRQQRRERYETKMTELGLSPQEQEKRLQQLNKIETQYIRACRVRLSANTFKTVKIIGRGSFGEVLLVQMRGTQKLYAMKKLRKSKMIERNQVDHCRQEKEALADLNDFYKQNAWVVRLYYSFQDALFLYLIMEYVPGGDLMSQLMNLEYLTEDETRFYIAELCLAVDSIHKLGYMHRDIKPDNILLDKTGHIKLSDFGLCTSAATQYRAEVFRTYRKRARHGSLDGEESSEAVSASESTDIRQRETRQGITNSWKLRKRVMACSEVGTPDYMAPEVLHNPDAKPYGIQADWWSVGVIMFEMLAGFPCFYSSSEDGDISTTYEKILNWRANLDQVLDEVQLSHAALSLIRSFLCEPEKRLGSKGINEIKAHPFFKGFDWDNIRTRPGPIIPQIDDQLDTQNFPVYEEDIQENKEALAEMAAQEERDKKFPKWGGRRLCPNDIPFIGFTYKNLAAVPSLLSSGN